MPQAAACCNKGKIPNRLLRRKRHLSITSETHLNYLLPWHNRRSISLVHMGKHHNCPEGRKKKKETKQKPELPFLVWHSLHIPHISNLYRFPCFPFKRGAQEDNVQNCNWKMSLRQAKGQGSSRSVTWGWMNSGFPFPHPSLPSASFFSPITSQMQHPSVLPR